MTSLVHILWFTVAALYTEKLEAMNCTIGQEPDPASNHRLRWVIPVEDPCQCTQVQVGGVNSHTPYRPFKVSYYDSFLHNDNQREIQQWLNCSDVIVCMNEKPLGMEDGTILDESITASSYYTNSAEFGPARARPNTEGLAAAWCSAGRTDTNPWIQVDFKTTVYITALITKGRGDGEQWVTEYQVAHSHDGLAWLHVTNVPGLIVTFPGNSDMNSLVTTRFRNALHTRFIRILPTKWFAHCSMRFELIGCYLSE